MLQWLGELLRGKGEHSALIKNFYARDMHTLSYVCDSAVVLKLI